MKHKWHDEIVAWAGGAEIEWAYIEDTLNEWKLENCPEWDNYKYRFRIKPQPKEKKFLYGYINNNGQVIFYDDEKRNENYIGKIEVLDD